MNKKELLEALMERFVAGFEGVNVTNGDVIKAMFPNIQIREVCSGQLVEFTFDGIVGTSVAKEYWTAPYRREE